MSEVKMNSKEDRIQRLLTHGFITAVLVDVFKKLSNDDLDAFYKEQLEVRNSIQEDITSQIQTTMDVKNLDFSILSEEDKNSLKEKVDTFYGPTEGVELSRDEKVELIKTLKEELGIVEQAPDLSEQTTDGYKEKYEELVVEFRRFKQTYSAIDLGKIKSAAVSIVESLK